ncbi:hypothetical protein [Virgibacillus subterraneus]|uniref:hypothetical protein n=1 Tax=Virgibacillus subterraneus TaxID=621109 RepID=UPI000B85B387|nr:hypothetical protein [Virgibacillus subterraneus]
MNKSDFIEKNWGQESILELSDTLGVSINEILNIALDLKLYKIDTPNIARRWTEEEETFLIEHSYHLSVRDASNLLYRSHYATYQRIRYLNLNEMINKSKG